jgi:hypothetical protein
MKGTENPPRNTPIHAWLADPTQVAIVQQMKEDLDWAMEHHSDLEQQYAGESVVIWQKQVIAHGSNEEELLQHAASSERPREQLVVVEFPSFFESPR